jgi:UDP-N-acetylmuramyl pentapeptide synthase
MKKYFVHFLLSYFRVLAKTQLKKNNPIIVGVTGTAGKTSTLTAIEAVLKEKKVKVSHKANSETGIPLNILGLKPKNFSLLDWLRLAFLAPFQVVLNWENYDYYVVEMGIDSPNPPKNMGHLLKIVQPQVGVFLNAIPMHSEPFDAVVDKKIKNERLEHENNDKKSAKLRRQLMIEAIAQEKGRMIESLPTGSEENDPHGGVAILNADQPEVIALATKTRAKVLSFGKAKSTTVRVVKIEQSLGGTKIELRIKNENNQNENGNKKIATQPAESSSLHLSFPNYLLPDHFAHTFGAAMCVGISQGLSAQATGKLLENNFELPPGRSSLIPGLHGSWIIDSSYNSSTQPLIDLLEMMEKVSEDKNPLTDTKNKKDSAPINKKIALLGDMRELGKESQLEHELVAQKASEICDEVILVGPEMKKHALPVLEKAIQTKIRKVKNTKWVKDAYEAAKYLKEPDKLQKNDLLLVKGSQNTLLLEIAVEKLMAKPEKAGELLCRREKFWEKKREELLS